MVKLADSKGDYSTTWKIIHDLSGKDQNPKVKVKMRDGTPPKSDKDLLAEWQEYFSSLLNNNNGQVPSDLPQPAAQDLPIHDHPPTLEETLEAIRQMKTNKAAGFDCAITAEALQGGGDAMADAIHCFCAEVYSNLTPPDQWITSVIVPLPKKGDLSLMTNYRGISLLSKAAKVYSKILLNRIRDEVDPILRKNQAGFCPGRSCAQQIHILRRVLESFRDYQLPLVVTFIDFDSINRKVMFAVLRQYGIPEAVVNAISVLYKKRKKRHYWSHAGRFSGSFSICCRSRWHPAKSLRGYCTSGPYFWRFCAFSQKIKQLRSKYPMDLVRNVPRNSKITILLQCRPLLWSYSEKCAKINIFHVLSHKSITTWVSETPVQ